MSTATPTISRRAFSAAAADRVRTDILDACTECGKCVQACPMIPAASIDASDPAAVVHGVLDLLTGGEGTVAARRWAEVCSGSGLCIPACPEGVNPRFMMYLAGAVVARAGGQPEANAMAGFNALARGVRMLSRLQLAPEVLQRLTEPRPDAATAPDVVFYTGCNILKTPHLALICLDVLDRLGVRYEVLGGPSHCCGTVQYSAGDTAGADRVALSSIGRLARPGAPRVLAWCPSCQVQLGEIQLPTYERAAGAAPFAFGPFYEYLAERLDLLRPLLRRPVAKRVALNERPGMPGVNAAVRRLLGAIPGVELVELDVVRAGVMSNALSVLPAFKAGLRQAEFDAAAAAGVTTLATTYHACQRELVRHSPEVCFEIVNVMELLGESMGIVHEDLFKQLVVLGDVDAIIARRAEQADAWNLDLDGLREVILRDMLMRQADGAAALPDPPQQ